MQSNFCILKGNDEVVAYFKQTFCFYSLGGYQLYS